MSLIDSFFKQNKSQNRVPYKIQKSFLNTFFDRVVVINLRRSVARLIKVTSQLKSLGIQYEIFNAIDGQQENIKKEYQQYLQNRDQESKKIKRLGEYAYLLTWIKLLNNAINQGWNRLLILEDDVLLSDDFTNRIQQWFHNIPKNALLWLLGATQLPHLRGSIDFDRNYFRPAITDGSFAIGLDKELFPFLISEIEKLDGPLDSGPLRAAYKKYSKQCYAASPYFVIAEVDDSTIRGSKDIREVAAKLEWDLNSFSTLKKNQKNLNIALTLYLRTEELDKTIRDLLIEKKITWNLFLIYKDHKNEDIANIQNSNVTIYEYQSTVNSLKMAEQLAEQHWVSLQESKFDRILFYDLALRLEDNVLHAISTFL